MSTSGTHFAAVGRLLRPATICKLKQRGCQPFELVYIDPVHFPTAVKVTRVLLRRDETAIDIGSLTASRLQREQCPMQPFQQLTPMVRMTKSATDFNPTCHMKAGRKIADGRIKIGYHNTIIMLCWLKDQEGIGYSHRSNIRVTTRAFPDSCPRGHKERAHSRSLECAAPMRPALEPS